MQLFCGVLFAEKLLQLCHMEVQHTHREPHLDLYGEGGHCCTRPCPSLVEDEVVLPNVIFPRVRFCWWKSRLYPGRSMTIRWIYRKFVLFWNIPWLSRLCTIWSIFIQRNELSMGLMISPIQTKSKA